MLKKATTTRTAKGFDGFSLLGRVVVRAPWLVIAAWIALVVVLSVAFPALTKVVESQTMQPLPPQAMAATEQMAKDFHESAQNIVVVAMTDEHGLTPADNDTYRALADKLRSDTTDVSAVQDFISTPALRQLMVSTDNKAFYMAVTLKAPAGSPESSQAYQRIAQIVKQSTAGSALTAHVTGQAAIVGDMSIVTARDMHVIEIATALLVLIILLVIYRRPVTVLLPLITIGVSVASAEGLVSALTEIGLSVSAITIVLMTAMIVGAGTDYAVFLISRYHEYIRSGMDSDVAVQQALSSIGKVIGASAATVAVTFLGMIFTQLPAFTSVGPALAVSIGSRVRRGRHAVARRSGAGGPARVGRTAAAAHRPTVAALGDSHRPAAQGTFGDQPDSTDRTRGLCTVHAPDIQRPHAVAGVSGEQPGIFRDGGALLDEHPAAGVHLHPLAARPEDAPGAGRHGTDGTACGPAARHRGGARCHTPDGPAARPDQGQLSSR